MYSIQYALLNPLKGFGRANERIGRIQESYAAQATATWLDTLERSLVQMKEYQVLLSSELLVDS